MKTAVVSLLAVVGLAGAAMAQPTLVPLSTFGVNGWRAPNVTQVGDSSGPIVSGSYLGLNASGDSERGLAYNKATGNLILVTRNGTITGGASPFRILDGQTARDKGELAFGSGVIAGGTFLYMQAAASDDGQIFVSNLTTDTGSSAYKVYKWSGEGAAAPTVHHSSTQAWATGGTRPRLGDSLDAFGSGTNVTLAAGYRGLNGVFTLTGSTSPVGQVYTNVTTPAPPAGSLALTGASGPTTPDFRLGLTFAQDASNVWGKVSSQALRQAALSGTGATAVAAGSLTSAGEAQIDFTTIGGVPYLAALDVNNSRVYVYDVSNPTSPVSLFPFGLAAQTGVVAANGNASGAVKWGAIDDTNLTGTIYTLNTNNGLQAFTFTVPAPGTAALLGLGGLVAARRRRN